MLLSFHWNVFDMYIQGCLIKRFDMIYRKKWHENKIKSMVKHRTLMFNKNVKTLLKCCVEK